MQVVLLGVSLCVCVRTLRKHAAPWPMVALYWALLTVKNLMEVLG